MLASPVSQRIPVALLVPYVGNNSARRGLVRAIKNLKLNQNKAGACLRRWMRIAKKKTNTNLVLAEAVDKQEGQQLFC
jgi:hypothetical protein